MIPVHVAVEKNIRNAVEEKSKWRIFQMGKFFAAVLIEETKDSKRPIRGCIEISGCCM